jgi:mannosyl-3-phosphoglycerate synthase
MRIGLPHHTERLGAVLVHGVQQVFELDSGSAHWQGPGADAVVEPIPYEKRVAIEQDMAIVVPMRGERLRLVEGVLAGIPNHCLTIVCSASSRTPVDRFAIEQDVFERYCRFTQKRMAIVHQKDPVLARAFQNAGYETILDERDGLIRSGKAEGMILSTVLARLAGQRTIGFVDADNYFPGAVLEYVHEYAAGFAMSKSAYTIVRISWQSKPKIMEQGLFFVKYGRTSRSTNRFLNQLISEYTGFETEIITTGNAGEHAMTLDLAMLLDYSSGYSIEPYHFVNLFERFGGLTDITLSQEMIQRHVEVFQIESRNPHMHDVDKGDEHVEAMTYAAVKVIYDSPVCPPRLKEELAAEMEQLYPPGQDAAPPEIRYYPPLSDLDLDAFAETIQDEPYAARLLHPRPPATSVAELIGRDLRQAVLPDEENYQI